MTREEATNRIISSATKGKLGWASLPATDALVDALSALGLLKLDDPPTELSRAAQVAKALSERNKGGPAIWPTTLAAAIEAAGLELVEKK